MSLPKSAADVLDHHIELKLESLDRIYLNVIQHRLQAENGVAYFFRHHCKEAFATAKVMAEMTKPFVEAIEYFTTTNTIPLIGFQKGQRKEKLAKEALESFADREGVRRPCHHKEESGDRTNLSVADQIVRDGQSLLLLLR